MPILRFEFRPTRVRWYCGRRTRGVRVPRMLAWCDDPEIIGRPFLLVAHVDGVSITDRLPDSYADAVETVNALGEQLIDALAEIHQVPWQKAGLGDFGNPENFLSRQVGRWRDIRARSSVRELPLIESLGQWLERATAALSNERGSF